MLRHGNDTPCWLHAWCACRPVRLYVNTVLHWRHHHSSPCTDTRSNNASSVQRAHQTTQCKSAAHARTRRCQESTTQLPDPPVCMHPARCREYYLYSAVSMRAKRVPPWPEYYLYSVVSSRVRVRGLHVRSRPRCHNHVTSTAESQPPSLCLLRAFGANLTCACNFYPPSLCCLVRLCTPGPLLH